MVLHGCGGDGPTGPDLNPDPTTLSDLFGNQLFKVDGSSVGVGTLSQVKVIGVYFASPTCPACTAFTPVLVDAYNQLLTDGRSFEVVLVAPGMNDESLFDFMDDSGMGWLAVLPRSSKTNRLLQHFKIQWVPTLVIIDSAGRTLSVNGREQLTQNGIAAYDSWLAAAGG